MNEANKKRYDDLSAQLPIDLLRIDQELMKMPQLVQETAELAVAVADEERATKMALEIISSEAQLRIRTIEPGMKPKTEGQVAAELVLQEDVQAARNDADHAKLDASLCRSLHSSMTEKSRLLGKACDMTIAGFIVPNRYFRKEEAANAKK